MAGDGDPFRAVNVPTVAEHDELANGEVNLLLILRSWTEIGTGDRHDAGNDSLTWTSDALATGELNKAPWFGKCCRVVNLATFASVVWLHCLS